MQNPKLQLIFRPDYSALTLNLIKIKNQPFQPLNVKWLTFPETRQIVLSYRLNKLRKNMLVSLFVRRATRSKFCTAETS